MNYGLNWARIGLVGLALCAFGHIYDKWTNRRRHQGRAEREVGAWVVGGVFVTLVGLGLLCGPKVFALALFCFACSGINMLRGWWRDYQARDRKGWELVNE